MTLLLSCKSASDIGVLQIDATGAIYGLAFVDGNGNGVLDASDQPLKGADVQLTAGGARVVQQVTTDSTGAYRMLDVPAGSYEVALSSSLLGDSLSLLGDSVPSVTIQRGDTTRVDLGVSFPFVPLSQVRALPAGKEIFTSGIALNPNLSYGDARLHVQSDTAYLRAINVARGAVNAGDSVRLKGRTAVDNGEPVLDQVTPVVLVGAAKIPVPVDVSTSDAATAKGGRLDAALVRVRTAEILDTATVNGDFHFHVDDGSGPVDVVVPAYLQLNTSSVIPDSILRLSQGTGLLVPQVDGTGQVRWHLIPRANGDLVLQVKQVDVGVGMSVDKPNVTYGDTVKIRVVATNAGPLAAFGVPIVDTIPSGLTLLRSSATRGAYTPATRTWSIDTLGVGGADTLELTAAVTTALASTLANRAWFTGIPHEADTNGGNNAAGVTVRVWTVKQADLGVVMTVSPDSAVVGDTVRFQVGVTNSGPFPATSVKVADSLPAGLAFLDATATRGSYSASSGTWAVDSVAAGTTESLTLRATVSATSTVDTLVNGAYSTGAQNEIDPNPANDTAAVAVVVGPGPSPVPVVSASPAPAYPPILMPMRTTLPADGTRTFPKLGLTLVGKPTTPFPLRSMGLEGSTSRSALSIGPD